MNVLQLNQKQNINEICEIFGVEIHPGTTYARKNEKSRTKEMRLHKVLFRFMPEKIPIRNKD